MDCAGNAICEIKNTNANGTHIKRSVSNTYLPSVLFGVRIMEIFSIRSSLKERALRANFVPFRLFL